MRWAWNKLTAQAAAYVGGPRSAEGRDKRAALFGPLVRYSSRLLAHMDKMYRAGRVGYCELIQVTEMVTRVVTRYTHTRAPHPSCSVMWRCAIHP